MVLLKWKSYRALAGSYRRRHLTLDGDILGFRLDDRLLRPRGLLLLGPHVHPLGCRRRHRLLLYPRLVVGGGRIGQRPL